MYIQITNICNMHCAHCGWSCNNSGTYMSEKIFRQCCEIAYNTGDHIFLGGGEPTLHPDFIEFLGMAVLYSNCDKEIKPGLITNGSNTDLTIKLLNAANNGSIFCNVSIDPWHDEIDDKVIELANRYNLVRSVKNDQVIPIGRAKDFEKNISSRRFKKLSECICDDVFVNPFGMVFTCGCQDKFIGMIRETEKIENYMRYERYGETSESSSF